MTGKSLLSRTTAVFVPKARAERCGGQCASDLNATAANVVGVKAVE